MKACAISDDDVDGLRVMVSDLSEKASVPLLVQGRSEEELTAEAADF